MDLASIRAVVASGATPAGTWPPADDLRVRPKPVPSDDVLTSCEAGEKHDNAIEADGDASRLQIGRLCRFFRDRGMPLPFECPKSPEPVNIS